MFPYILCAYTYAYRYEPLPSKGRQHRASLERGRVPLRLVQGNINIVYIYTFIYVYTSVCGCMYIVGSIGHLFPVGVRHQQYVLV